MSLFTKYNLIDLAKLWLKSTVFLVFVCTWAFTPVFYPILAKAESTEQASDQVTTTVEQPTDNMCSKYEADPKLAFMNDTFDKETFIGIASTSQRGIPFEYTLANPDLERKQYEGERFDVIAFTPKVWYSHHPTDSTVYVVISNGAPAEVSTSTAPSAQNVLARPRPNFINGESYVISGEFLKSASSSAWALLDPLPDIITGSSSAKIMINNECVAPLKATNELFNQLGQPLTSFDKYEFTRTLGLGMSGDDVRELNLLLGLYNRYPSASSTVASTTQALLDSKYFGKQTRASLIKYQEINAQAIDIRVATGFFGEKTMSYVNTKRVNDLNDELTCTLPTFARASTTTAILYDQINATTTLVSGNFDYASTTRPDRTVDLDLSFVVDSISSSTPDVLRNAKKAIVAQTASLDLSLSQIKVASSTWFIPYDNVRDFSRYIGRNSVSEGKISRIQYYSEDVPLYFPQAIACGRVLR